MSANKDVIQQTTDDVREQAQKLITAATYGALAVLDPQTGHPGVTRVAVATDYDNTPLLLASGLASHTPALDANPACSLLLGEPAVKGDPLVHPRITLACRAQKFTREDEDYPRLRNLFLEKRPKVKLYIDLGDFVIFRLNIESASLNGGFGKAYQLNAEDILLTKVTANVIK
ncbi:HugZ family protein [Pseudochrobactrum sp. HB0163]|uniref:HugZ family pyridoxamine 5'-phosphate oxidase n=1 Tax=Pseudochrobactrum sp. HB0163 TaxID=3450708 RepID=UPI003F6E1D12